MRWVLIFIVSLVFMGCSFKPDPLPANQKLRLEVMPVSIQPRAISAKVLKVSTPYGLRSLQGRDILYTHGDGVYKPYRDHHWEDTPARQLTLLLSNALQESGLFSTVISAPSRVRYDYVLESRVSAFEHHLEDEKSFVRLHVSLYLVEGVKKEVVSSLRFTWDEPTPTIDAKGVGQAFNKAIERLHKESILWLGGLGDTKTL